MKAWVVTGCGSSPSAEVQTTSPRSAHSPLWLGCGGTHVFPVKSMPGLWLGGLGISRARLVSKLYSGSLQTSTFCLGPGLEISAKICAILTLGVAKLSPTGSFQLCICWCPRDSLCVLRQEEAKDEKQGYRRRVLFSFHTKRAVNMLFILSCEKLCQDFKMDWLLRNLFLID